MGYRTLLLLYYYLHFDLSEIIAFARYCQITPACPVTSETVQLSIQYSNSVSMQSASLGEGEYSSEVLAENHKEIVMDMISRSLADNLSLVVRDSTGQLIG